MRLSFWGRINSFMSKFWDFLAALILIIFVLGSLGLLVAICIREPVIPVMGVVIMVLFWALWRVFRSNEGDDYRLRF
jgi:hypothetical protein